MDYETLWQCHICGGFFRKASDGSIEHRVDDDSCDSTEGGAS